MTVRKMYEKYVGLTRQNYETVFITQVLNDLYQCLRPLRKKKKKK